jgi:predicted anti-sigma-YlaC factor YlaD
MKGCSHWTDAIIDCALGKTPEPGLAAHLAICPQCRTALQENQEKAARIDQVLHRSAEPPVYGPERVMARIRARTNTRMWWRWAALGSVVLAVLIAIAMWVRRPPAADVTTLSTWRSPTQALLRPPVAAAWATKPRLGEEFFKMKSSGEIHEQ